MNASPEQRRAELRQLADYAMAFSLIPELASARTEDQVIAHIVRILIAICAPSHTTYLQVAESPRARLVSEPQRDCTEADAERLGRLTERWATTPGGRGFSLRIDDAAGTLGIVELEDVAVPASLEHYVNLGLGLVPLFALAIQNARTFERLEGTLADLRQALDQVKTLHAILPICAWCKRVKDEVGAWSDVEVYVREHSSTEFSHGICPACARALGGDTDGA